MGEKPISQLRRDRDRFGPSIDRERLGTKMSHDDKSGRARGLARRVGIDEIASSVQKHRAELIRAGIGRIVLFGSVARGQAPSRQRASRSSMRDDGQRLADIVEAAKAVENYVRSAPAGESAAPLACRQKPVTLGVFRSRPLP